MSVLRTLFQIILHVGGKEYKVSNLDNLSDLKREHLTISVFQI